MMIFFFFRGEKCVYTAGKGRKSIIVLCVVWRNDETSQKGFMPLLEALEALRWMMLIERGNVLADYVVLWAERRDMSVKFEECGTLWIGFWGK